MALQRNVFEQRTFLTKNVQHKKGYRKMEQAV